MASGVSAAAIGRFIAFLMVLSLPYQISPRTPVDAPDLLGDEIHRLRDLFKHDLPLGPMHEFVGDARLAAAWPVLVPALGEEQVAGQHAAEGILRIVVGVEQVLGDDAVVDLAAFPARLPMHAGRLLAALGMPRGVEHHETAGLRAGPIGRHLRQQPIHPGLVPDEEGQ
jgi:hypothetical protein